MSDTSTRLPGPVSSRVHMQVHVRLAGGRSWEAARSARMFLSRHEASFCLADHVKSPGKKTKHLLRPLSSEFYLNHR